jgi:5-methyltetrahydrofolate--homocysteine methyltransferase
VPSVFRNTPPANAEDESLRTAPEDWRAQTAEQKAAINQFHIAAVAEHFRQTGARVKQHAEDLPLDRTKAGRTTEIALGRRSLRAAD